MAAERSAVSLLLIPGACAALTIALQIAYPLVHGAGRNRLIVAVVIAFAATSMAHAWLTRGIGTAVAVFVVAAGVGFAAEVLGVHTGVPFGRYAYTHSLGPRAAGVPVVIALAWVMFAWPSAGVARLLARGMPARVLVGAWLLASWDLFLDPQMVAAGQWSWRDPQVHLPGVPAVPLTNYAGWLAVSLVVSAVMQALLPDGRYDDRIPVLLVLWTYFSSVLAFVAFLHLAAAAAWGALGMGLVVLPVLMTLRGRAQR